MEQPPRARVQEARGRDTPAEKGETMSIPETIRECRERNLEAVLAPMTLRTVAELRNRLVASKVSYGAMSSVHEAMGVLDGEVHELRLAIHARDTANIYEEMADCANTCIRWMQEMEARGLV